MCVCVRAHIFWVRMQTMEYGGLDSSPLLQGAEAKFLITFKDFLKNLIEEKNVINQIFYKLRSIIHALFH